MTDTQVRTLDESIHTTNEWLRDLAGKLGVENRGAAYIALRGALKALRDRLPVDDAAHLGAQLLGEHVDGRPCRREQPLDIVDPLGHDDAKFGQMRPDRVHQLSALADEEVPRLVVQQGRLPLGRLHRRRAEGTPAA